MTRRFRRGIRIAVTITIGGAMAAAAIAQQPQAQQASRTQPPSPATAADTAPASPVTAAPSAVVPPHIEEVRRALAGMIVAIDPATGELRAPDAAEVEALTGTAQAARFAVPRPLDLPGGGAVARTAASSVDLLTVTRGADGTITYTCSHGIDSASATFAAQHERRATGVRDDR